MKKILIAGLLIAATVMVTMAGQEGFGIASHGETPCGNILLCNGGYTRSSPAEGSGYQTGPQCGKKTFSPSQPCGQNIIVTMQDDE